MVSPDVSFELQTHLFKYSLDFFIWLPHGLLLLCPDLITGLLQSSTKCWSCPTLCDPMDRRLPGSSVHGVLQAKY